MTEPRRRPTGRSSRSKRVRVKFTSLAELLLRGNALHDISGQNPLAPSTFESSQRSAHIDIEKATRGSLKHLTKGGATGGEIDLMMPSQTYANLLRKLRYVDWTRLADRFVVKIVSLTDDPNERQDAYNDAVAGYHLNRLRFSGLPSGAPITPCFAQVIDWFRSSTGGPRGTQYTIMEHADFTFERYLGGRLVRLVSGGGLIPSARRLLAHVAMVLHALEAAWEWFGYLHYDLHEGNVLMRKARPNVVAQSDWTFERARDRDNGDRARGTLRFSPDDHGGLIPTVIDFGMNRLQVPYRGAERDGYELGRDPGLDVRFTRIVHGDSVLQRRHGRVTGTLGPDGLPPNRGWDIRRWGLELLTWMGIYAVDRTAGGENARLIDELSRVLLKMTGVDVWLRRTLGSRFGGTRAEIARTTKIRAALDDAVRDGRYFEAAMAFDPNSPHGEDLFDVVLRDWCWSANVYEGQRGSRRLIYARTPSDVLDDELFAKSFGDVGPSRPGDERMAEWRDPASMNDTATFTPVESRCEANEGTRKSASMCRGPLCRRVAARVCGRCRRERYCSPECQTNAWRMHRDECSETLQ